MDDSWNLLEANRVVSNALVEIDALAEQLIPARAEALLDEFERAIQRGFRLQMITIVTAMCEEYTRRFRALAAEE